MLGEGREGARIDGLTALQVYRAAGELLDDGVVITQLDAPHILGRVVVVRVGFVEAVAATPDAFPIIEFVGGLGQATISGKSRALPEQT